MRRCANFLNLSGWQSILESWCHSQHYSNSRSVSSGSQKSSSGIRWNPRRLVANADIRRPESIIVMDEDLMKPFPGSSTAFISLLYGLPPNNPRRSHQPNLYSSAAAKFSSPRPKISTAAVLPSSQNDSRAEETWAPWFCKTNVSVVQSRHRLLDVFILILISFVCVEFALLLAFAVQNATRK